MKIVINKCHGGFGLSDEAVEYYGELKNLNLIKQTNEHYTRWYVGEINGDNYFVDRFIARNDPDFVRVVEELGPAANGKFSELKIVEIPDDVDWTIMDYDGVEWVAEVHRTWK
jgi:hypothetical protein